MQYVHTSMHFFNTLKNITFLSCAYVCVRKRQTQRERERRGDSVCMRIFAHAQKVCMRVGSVQMRAYPILCKEHACEGINYQLTKI